MLALRRELGLRDLVLFNVIAVVGIRWLAAAAQVGASSIALWLLAAVLFFVPSALAVATLSRSLPEEGGLYIWTQHSFGDWHGFLCGWCYWISNLFYFPNLIVLGISIAAHTFGVGENVPHSLILSVAVLWIALLPNIFGVQFGKWIGNTGALATYAAGILLIVCGLAAGIRGGSATEILALPRWDFAKLNFWSQIAFAFGGLELGAILAGEIRNPERNIPRAAWISGLAISVFYILGTIAMLILLAPERISILTGLVQAGDAAASRLGVVWLGPVLGFLVCAAIIGQLGTWVAGSARIPFVIGIDRYFPEAFARLHPRWQTPYISMLVQGGASTLFLVILQAGESLRVGYQLLVDMTVMTYFIPFMYLFGSAWKFGRRWSAASGLFTTALALVLSLVPPGDVGSVATFELKLVGGCAALIAAARFWFNRARRLTASASG